MGSTDKASHYVRTSTTNCPILTLTHSFQSSLTYILLLYNLCYILIGIAREVGEDTPT